MPRIPNESERLMASESTNICIDGFNLQLLTETLNSKIYLAVPEGLKKKYIVKIAKSEKNNSRIITERQALGALNHPNIVDIIGCGHLSVNDDTLHYNILEYLPKTLRQVLDEKIYSRATTAGTAGPTKTGHWAWCFPYIEQLLHAVDVCHRNNILHRDLKPENVLLTEQGKLKLCDFGGAAVPEENKIELEHSLDQTVEIAGTIKYQAPEQRTGQVDLISFKTDIYSLGLIFYEMLTLQTPDGLITAMPSSSSSDIPKWFDDLLTAMLQKDPVKRPTAANLLEAIRQRVAETQPPIPTICPPKSAAPSKFAQIYKYLHPTTIASFIAMLPFRLLFLPTVLCAWFEWLKYPHERYSQPGFVTIFVGCLNVATYIAIPFVWGHHTLVARINHAQNSGLSGTIVAYNSKAPYQGYYLLTTDDIKNVTSIVNNFSTNRVPYTYIPSDTYGPFALSSDKTKFVYITPYEIIEYSISLPHHATRVEPVKVLAKSQICGFIRNIRYFIAGNEQQRVALQIKNDHAAEPEIWTVTDGVLQQLPKIVGQSDLPFSTYSVQQNGIQLDRGAGGKHLQISWANFVGHINLLEGEFDADKMVWIAE